MENFIQRVLTNWQVLITIMFGLYALTKAYDINNMQETKIAEIDKRVVHLESNKNQDDTNWAGLKVQLSTMQTDLTEIKSQLKEVKKREH